ncbi:hypothetical protein DOTSEDRAFT_127304 [Dothistroma septosporum NZE10]|uniref:ASST-domain-containing protein n=1 Tax=Dothistroma septosporum (strain NZE10 / CBS 128990) TaxID=675120 RepID=N1PU25_DOTSN|nr:hypothetical protein DOTSEDRAFT_127304 [Dothistroma septosporum NZE10]
MAWAIGVLATSLAIALAVRDRDPERFEDGSDLHHFISRPDLTSPRYNVIKHHPEAITQGYWFVTPYAGLAPQGAYLGRKEHSPYQIGPHIYDGDGNLVWNGASNYNNRNTFGLTPMTINDTQYLSLYITGEHLGDGISGTPAIVLPNNRYEEVSRLEDMSYDLHEFNILPNGRSALISTNGLDTRNAAELGQGQRALVISGFSEVDLISGEKIFEWNPVINHISLDESRDSKGRPEDYPAPWDFLHLNSIDKFANGDYMISARHTSTVYRISGSSGEVIWRLGGSISDFVMEHGVDFSWQHHVRILAENRTHITMSIFDNHGEDEGRNTNMPQLPSAAKFVVLDTGSHPKTAKLLRTFDHPNNSTSEKLGSIQVMGEDFHDAASFVSWSIQGHVSEYNFSNRLVLDAKFVSTRMSSYRAYKSTFIGMPATAPDLKLHSMVTATNDFVTTFHVSWNGATEVESWTFYGSRLNQSDQFTRLGQAKKHGFETSWIAQDLVAFAYAEAIESMELC